MDPDILLKPDGPLGVIVASLSGKLSDNRSGLGRTLAEALRVSLCPRDERTLPASVTYHTPSGLRGPFALAPVVARRHG